MNMLLENLKEKIIKKLFIRENNIKIIKDYDIYYFTYKDFLRYLITGLLISSIIGILFYRSIIAVILMSPYSLLYLKNKRNELRDMRKWKLNLEFREGINSISSALDAGYSIENAFVEALEDIRIMFSEDSLIVKEFEHITRQLSMNVTVEVLLGDLARRSNVEDISNFSEVFITAKRSGGDIIKIIKSTSKNIGEKIEVKREIITLITAKRFEQRIMNMIPFGIILYLWVSSPHFLDCLYYNISGIFIMSICLIIYYFAYTISNRIVDIKV